MSVGNEINRIKQGKKDIITAIQKKGVSISNTITINEIAPFIEKIGSIDMSDSNAIASDIRKDKIAYTNNGRIVGTSVAGDGTEIPDATENDIVLNKIAYGENGVIHGRKQFSTYYTGTQVPSDTIGNEGDLYFKK